MLYLLVAACTIGFVGAEIFNRIILKNVEQGLTKLSFYGIIKTQRKENYERQNLDL